MTVDTASALEQLRSELFRLANEQFDTPQYRRLLSVRFTPQGARAFEVQRTHFVKNRRDCWGYVQGAAPLDVKRLVWAHEQEELMGVGDTPDHITLSIQEAEQFGLAAGEFDATRPTDLSQTCFYAWLHLAKDRPWLEAVAASSVLEMVVSDEIVRGGGIVRRLGEKMAADLGVPLTAQISSAVHVVVDVEHANLLLQVAQRYAHTEQAREAILRGASASLAVERVFRGHLADLIAGAD